MWGISRHTPVPLVQVHVQTGRTLELKHRRIDPSLLGSVGFPAGMGLVVVVSPMSLVGAEETGRLYGCMGVRQADPPWVQLRVQSRRTVGLRENGTEPIYVELSGGLRWGEYWNGYFPYVPH